MNSRLTLILLLLASLTLRLWGIDFGLPGKYRPDEEYLVHGGLAVLSGNFNPHPYIYPALFKYILGLSYFCSMHVGELFSLFGDGGFHYFNSISNLSFAWLQARVVTAFFGTLGVYAAYLLGKELRDEKLGLLVATLLGCNFIHIRDSHFAVTDVPMTTFGTFALLYMLRVARTGSWGNYHLAALFTGLAMSTKYTALALGVPFAVAHVVFLIGSKTAPWNLRQALRALDGALLCFVVFILGSPYIIFDRPAFQKGIEVVRSFAKNGLMNREDIYGWHWIFGFCLPEAFGWFLLVVVIGSLLLYFASLRREPVDSSPLVIVISLPLALLFTYVQAKWTPIRYMTFIAPCVCAIAAWGIRELASRKGGNAIAVCAIVLCALGPMLRTVELNTLLTKRDTREIASDWIDENIPPGTAIASNSYFLYGKPSLNDARNYRFPPRGEKAVEDGLSWLVVDEHPINTFSAKRSPEIEALLRERGELLFSVSPFEPRAGSIDSGTLNAGTYDISDAFYAPLSGFNHVIRPGPILHIYKLKP